MVFTHQLDGLYRQMVAGSAASLGVLSSAVVFAWVTPTLPSLLRSDSEIPMTPEQASWMVTMPEFGNFISPLPACYIADHFGRKTAILTSAPIFFIGWAIVIYFKTIAALNIGRIIKGVAIGIVYTVVPIYLGEISSPRHRGAVTSLFYIFWWFGFLFEYALGPHLSFMNFTLVSAFTSILFFFCLVWQPESPYYYLMKSDLEKAEISLTWFMESTDEAVSEELETMKRCIDDDRKEKVKWNELVTNPTDRKALLILFIVGFIRQCCGIIPLSVYSTETLKTTDENFIVSPDNVTIIMGVSMLGGCFISFFTVDKFGRKNLLFVSCTVSGISVLSCGVFYMLQSAGMDVSLFSWVPPIAMVLLSGMSVLGIFPVNVAYSSELFTSDTRVTASGVFNIYTTLLGVIVVKFYLTVSNNFGLYLNFFFFTFTCFLGSVLSCIMMPETKGKTFEQIRKELH